MKIDGQADRSIAPGTTEEVKVSMSTRARRGAFAKAIRVQTNDAQNRSTTLTCKGRALVPFTTNVRIVNFTALSRDGGPQTRTVEITRGDGGPLALELLPIKEPQLSAQLREIEAGERYEMDITLSPPWPTGTFRGGISLATGVSEAPVEMVTVLGRIPPRLKANPPRFSVPNELAEKTEMRARLIWSGNNPGKVLDAVPSDKTLEARVEEKNGVSYIVLVVPADFKPRGVASVTVMTDDKEAPNIRIPIVRSPSRTYAPPGGKAARPVPQRPAAKPTPRAPRVRTATQPAP